MGEKLYLLAISRIENVTLVWLGFPRHVAYRYVTTDAQTLLTDRGRLPFLLRSRNRVTRSRFHLEKQRTHFR